MAAIGTPGEFVRSCNHEQHVRVGVATPPNSPNGGGKRIVPDAGCAQQFLVDNARNSSDFGTGLHESWQTSNDIRTAEGHSLASFDPYFQSELPEPVPRSVGTGAGEPSAGPVLPPGGPGSGRSVPGVDPKRRGRQAGVRRPQVGLQRRSASRRHQLDPDRQPGWPIDLVHEPLRQGWASRAVPRVSAPDSFPGEQQRPPHLRPCARVQPVFWQPDDARTQL